MSDDENPPAVVAARLDRYIRAVVLAEVVFLPLLFLAASPRGLILNLDTFTYLRHLEIVPPFFSILISALFRFDDWLQLPHFVSLKLLGVALYGLGTGLIARTLLRARARMLALMTPLLLWSASSFTFYFNAALTEGVATACALIALGCLIRSGSARQQANRAIAGSLSNVMAFLLRPGFIFVLPWSGYALLVRPALRWRGLLQVGACTLAALVVGIGLGYVYHGRYQSHLGLALFPLVFHLEGGTACAVLSESDCRVHMALERHRQAYAEKDFDGRLNYLIYSFSEISGEGQKAAQASQPGNDPGATNATMQRIAIALIRRNPGEYISFVLRNAVAAFETKLVFWHYDWLGWQVNEAIDYSNTLAPRLRAELGYRSDGIIRTKVELNALQTTLLQSLQWLMPVELYVDASRLLALISIAVVVATLFMAMRVEFTLAALCFAFIWIGILVLNALTPPIPRYLAPFHPFLALGFFAALIGALKAFVEGLAALLRNIRSRGLAPDRSATARAVSQDRA